MGWCIVLISGGTPSEAGSTVSSSSYSSARRTESATEDIDNQVEDCNDDLVDEDKRNERTLR